MSKSKKHGPLYVISTIVLFCIVFVGIAACGKKGNPNPPPSSDLFRVEEVTATLQTNCLVFTGSLQGARNMFDKFRLEISFLGEDGSNCPSCPFVPEEISFIGSDQINMNTDTGEFSFTYCTQSADGYRWRIYGLSKDSNIPLTQSPIHLIYK